jgi:hypothetical protein
MAAERPGMMAVGPETCANILRSAIEMQHTKFDIPSGERFTALVARKLVSESVDQLASIRVGTHDGAAVVDSIWAIDAYMGTDETPRHVRLVPVLHARDLADNDDEPGFVSPRGCVYIPVDPKALSSPPDAQIKCWCMLEYDAAVQRERYAIDPVEYVAALEALCAHARARGFLVPLENEPEAAWVARDELVLATGGANRACLVRNTYSPDGDTEFLGEADRRAASHGIVVVAPDSGESAPTEQPSA